MYPESEQLFVYFLVYLHRYICIERYLYLNPSRLFVFNFKYILIYLTPYLERGELLYWSHWSHKVNWNVAWIKLVLYMQRFIFLNTYWLCFALALKAVLCVANSCKLNCLFGCKLLHFGLKAECNYADQFKLLFISSSIISLHIDAGCVCSGGNLCMNRLVVR